MADIGAAILSAVEWAEAKGWCVVPGVWFIAGDDDSPTCLCPMMAVALKDSGAPSFSGVEAVTEVAAAALGVSSEWVVLFTLVVDGHEVSDDERCADAVLLGSHLRVRLLGPLLVAGTGGLT